MKKELLLLYILIFSNLIFCEVKTIKLVTDNHFIPYAYLENGNVVGSDIDVIRAIEKRLNLNIIIDVVPWKRALYMIETGISDGGFSLFNTEERKEWAYFTNYPIHISKFNIFTRKGDEFEYNNIYDLIGKKIGINSGFAISEKFDKFKDIGTLKVIESEDADTNLKLLKNGRIDCYIGNTNTLSYKLKENDNDNLISMLPNSIFSTRGSYIVFSKKSKLENLDSLILDINETLKDLYEEGIFKDFASKYIEK